MCLYCKDLLTDGFVPAEQVGLLVYPLDLEHGNQLAKQLASVGLIKEVSNTEASDKQDQAQGWQVAAFLKRNGTREDVERLSQVRAEAGRAGGVKSRKPPAQKTAQANRKQVAKQKVSQPDPYTETESDTETEEKEETPATGTFRDDVERLCLHLADRIEGNGCKRPTVTQKWRDAARLMLDRDERAEDKIRKAIDWCQDSEFWRTNVMSMPTLREQYDRLQLQAQREAKDRGAAGKPPVKQASFTDEEYTSGW